MRPSGRSDLDYCLLHKTIAHSNPREAQGHSRRGGRIRPNIGLASRSPSSPTSTSLTWIGHQGHRRERQIGDRREGAHVGERDRQERHRALAAMICCIDPGRFLRRVSRFQADSPTAGSLAAICETGGVGHAEWSALLSAGGCPWPGPHRCSSCGRSVESCWKKSPGVCDAPVKTRGL